MLVGYPQESDQEFGELCDFVKEMEFDRLGVFQYSHEESTRAFDIEDDISPELKAERANELMEIQQEISTRKNHEKVGKTFKTLFDRKEGGYFVGRTEGDSPEVDNEVLVPAKKQFARIGDFAQVRITEATEYDIYGEIVA